MSLEAYLQNIPLLHSWDGGRTWGSGGFTKEQLKLTIALIQETFSSPRIIETGAGNSTISFLFCNPSAVISICPDKIIFEKINSYCANHSIGTEQMRGIVGFSEWELPQIAEGAKATGQFFDFALIDGHHGWPNVFVDFCYINALTSQGSLIMIDDIQLHSVRELANFLIEQPGFSLVTDLGKALIFRKTTRETGIPEWIDQPYIVRRSAPPLPARLRQFASRSIRPIIEKLPFGPSLVKAAKRLLRP